MNKFSVVICTYNGSNHIIEVLNAIYNCVQINELVEEVVVVDNASTDNLKELVQCYMVSHNKVKYYYEAKSGLANARKRAVCCNAEWIVYFDDDNLPCDSWFVNANRYIKEHNEVGVFCGRNIAEIREEIKEEEKNNLYAMKGNLACHYVSYEDYKNKENGSALSSIFGAGMMIRRDILVDFLNSGWTIGEGRNRSELGAYEDSEIVNYAIQRGYGQGVCESNYLYHIIARNRLQTEYLYKLRAGMEKSEINVILNREGALHKRTKLLIIDTMKFVKYSLVFLVTRNDIKKTFAKFIIHSSVSKIAKYPHDAKQIVFFRK